MTEEYDLGPAKGYEPPDPGQRAYLGKERAGRSVRLVDPRGPLSSEGAAQLRQTIAIGRANAAQNAQDSPESYDLGESQGNTRIEEYDLTGGKPERSRGKSLRETYQGYRPSWDSPEPPTDPLAVPGYLATETAKTGLGMLGELTAPVFTARDYLYGVLAGHPGTPTSPEDIADSVRSLQGTGPKTDQWGDWKTDVLPGVARGVTELVPFLGVGGRGRRIPAVLPEETPLAPRVMSPAELDMQIAERAVATGYPEPESSLIPSMRRATGETVFAPTLEAGVHGPTQGRTSRRDALGNKVRTPTGVSPGEFGPEEQLTLLGGPTREGLEPTPKGAYLYAPEEQTQIGLVPLRPQRLFTPEHEAGLNQPLALDITSALRTRVFTVEEEQKYAEGWKQLGFTTEADRGPAFTPGLEEALAKGETPSVHAPPLGGIPSKVEQDLLQGVPEKGAKFPSMPERIIPSVVDIMRRYGTLGNSLADMTDWVYTTRARSVSIDVMNLDKAIDSAVGVRTFWGKQGQNLAQIRGENIFVKGMERHWNLSEKDKELIFNHLDSGGVEPVPPRLQPVADALYEYGSKPASADPGVQSLTITDPITGKQYPVGQPSKFMPHRPVTQMAKDALNDFHWKALYQRRGGEDLGISLAQFKERVRAVLNYDQDVVAQKMRGLESARMLDLGSLGGSRYQWAKKLGMETDPYRAIVQFNAAARLRGNIAQVEQGMQTVLDMIPAEDTAAKTWLTIARNRVIVHKGDFDMTTDLTKTLRGVSHISDVLMLPLGGLANLAQQLYPIARGGFIPTLKSFGSVLNPADRAMVTASGARFPALLNEITQPTGPMATLSSAAFHGYALHPVDTWTRFFAGHVGNEAIKGYERGLLKHPSSQRMQGLIRELGGDPAEVLRVGKAPDEMRQLMIQRFANYTAGVTDVRGVGLWLTSENPVYKLVNKYRNFSMANAAEIQRSVLNAPDIRTGIERGVRLIIGGYAIGGGVNEARKALIASLMGQEAPKTKEDAAAQLERLALGLGAAHGMLLVQLAARPEMAVISAVAGPTVGLLGRLASDINDTVKMGPGWRSIDTLSGLGPTGPILGPLVDAKKKKESRRYQDQLHDMGFFGQ